MIAKSDQPIVLGTEEIAGLRATLGERGLARTANLARVALEDVPARLEQAARRQDRWSVEEVHHKALRVCEALGARWLGGVVRTLREDAHNERWEELVEQLPELRNALREVLAELVKLGAEAASSGRAKAPWDGLPGPGAAPPANEDERLRGLRELGVLDTGPDPGLDRLTRIAARAFGTRIVLVSLVDASRQWFKSCVGIDQGAETPRSAAFCGYAIREPDRVLEVLDPPNDPRFRDNPLVIGAPKIRYYAGAPLVDGQGRALGTLCVIHDQPREPLNPDEQAMLRDLADCVVSQLLERQRRLRLSAVTSLLKTLGDPEVDGRTPVAHGAHLEDWNALATLLRGGAPVDPTTSRRAGLELAGLVERSLQLDEVVAAAPGQEVRLDALAKTVVELLAPRAKQRFVELSVRAPEEPTWVHAGRDRVEAAAAVVLGFVIREATSSSEVAVEVGVAQGRPFLAVLGEGPGLSPVKVGVERQQDVGPDAELATIHSLVGIDGGELGARVDEDDGRTRLTISWRDA